MSSHQRASDPPAFRAVPLDFLGRHAARNGEPAVADGKRRDPPPVIKLKSPREIALMREAGRVVAKALDQVRRLAVPGATTADMDEAVAADLPGTRGDPASSWATPARSRESRRSPP